MQDETQKEEEKKGSLVMGVSFTRWLIRSLVGGICTVSLYLNGNYKETIKKQDLTIEKQAGMIDSCYQHRFDEMTHRDDEKNDELRELRNELMHRIDSLTKK